MAEHAGRSLAEAVELRYDDVKQKIQVMEGGEPPAEETRLLLQDESQTLLALQAELSDYGDGPPSSLAPGSPERTAWFQTWLQERCNRDSNDDGEGEGGPGSGVGMTRDQFLGMLQSNPQLLAMAED